MDKECHIYVFLLTFLKLYMLVMDMRDIFHSVKAASRKLAIVADATRNAVLETLADKIEAKGDVLLDANSRDLARMDRKSALYDRLQLNKGRLMDIARSIREVASLSSPLGRILMERTLANGLVLRKVSVPFGVIGVVYEARPNVTFDVFSLCLKSGNACVLKGGSDAEESNKAAMSLIHEALKENGVDATVAEMLPSTHEATSMMLNAVGFVDVCIPRGGRKLIDFVRETAQVPVIETGAGVVSTYFDSKGDVEKGRRIVENAKTRRVSVCNALDCLIVDSNRLADVPSLCSPLAGHNVRIYADDKAFAILENNYPTELLCHATVDSYGTEFMDYAMALKIVDGVDEAIEHIAEYGSCHSESIVTEDKDTARYFQQRVDAACVYWNAPTSFTDGGQFGLGAEIGISTQKLGPRGPMGLEEMTTYKWLVDGNGQVRP